MNRLILKKQKHDEPEFDELLEMLCGLKDFLNEDADPNDLEWSENLDAILDFQDPDGSFSLLDSFDVPTDARVDFCHMPTYLCTAALMKACMTDSQTFAPKVRSALQRGLEMSCSRNLRGHGYEALKGQIEALNIFMRVGLSEFMDLHPDLCPEFSEMIGKIVSGFDEMESQGNLTGPWGESYEDDIRSINEYFSQRKVFVYGTLMEGEANHHHLENSACLGKAFIEGYDMHDMGSYPAVVPGENIVIGELYQVPLKDIPSIDALEAEGSLYIKKCETVTCADGKATFALVYVYNGDCSGNRKIPAWNMEYVWYVSYGSNMHYERFMRYIKGGSYEGSKREACNDTTPPLAVRTLEIPYGMYFGNRSQSWQGKGVSFLDATEEGKALGVAYLITKEQFEHVAAQENGGRFPNGQGEWYEDIIDLGEMDGFRVRTITNRNPRQYNAPCQAYLNTLHKGIRENWPQMSDEEIHDYLDGCIR